MSKNVSIKQAGSLLKKTYSRWSTHNAPRLGASLAFYSILSLAPLLILITGMIGLVFGHANAHAGLVREARQMMGEHGAETVESLLKNAQKPASGILANVIAFITLLFGASGVFTELQDALNIMWDAPEQESPGFIGMIRQRLFSVGMVLFIGFLLLILMLLNSAVAFVGQSFSRVLPMPPAFVQFLSFVVSSLMVTALFALMFKYVPNVYVAWREVIVGAAGTALLFAVGDSLLGVYLGRASVTSTYGAAGSLVALVVWIYYSAQIFLFGAEFTRVHADAQRGRSAQQPHVTAPIERASAAAVQTSQSIGKPKTVVRSRSAVSVQVPAITAPVAEQNKRNTPRFL